MKNQSNPNYVLDYLPKMLANPERREALARRSATRERSWTDEMKQRARKIARSRILFVGSMFGIIFMSIALKMNSISASDPAASTPYRGSKIIMQRADILDRNGHVLAMNIDTHALYAQPPQMVDPQKAVDGLVRIFPDLKDKQERLLSDFSGKRKFLWIRKNISPEQRQAVHDLGEPGLLFGPREMRLYPNGKIASHVLGGSTFGNEGVSAAEVIGVAGVEKKFDTYLRDPKYAGMPLHLSLDLTTQIVVEDILQSGMTLMNAKGASAVLMDVHTGEIISMASLPDFDPNNRPTVLTTGDQGDSPLFNRSVQGVYELGSVFKIFPAAQSIDLGLSTQSRKINTESPMRVGRFRIRDYRNYGKELTVRKVIAKSSNVGTARLVQEIGVEKQKAFLKSLGMFEATPVELSEASSARPIVPARWSDAHAVTISYGHGISTSPLHVAAGYAAIANGGHYVAPTLQVQEGPTYRHRVLGAAASKDAREMLRAVVTEGTASFADVKGYQVGGKTGTADKPKPTGGYYKSKVVATFASIFPASDPKYVLVVSLDEPEDTAGRDPRRTAGWTATPIGAEIISRTAPLLGLEPIYFDEKIDQ